MFTVVVELGLLVFDRVRFVRVMFVVKKIKPNLVEKQAGPEQGDQYNICFVSSHHFAKIELHITFATVFFDL
ncbi:MAG TPA: hypothetical protein VKQ08_10675 [Cyclobacteriaceae bacterium]|nr:hypothetical protein [Cyclobacteriaceae bacterium]